ncbi:hypothetical protein [Haloplanus halobius]|uniref:hypothetical protein n=1 Tax=Haloplanus halobius TaxID=2934938 RepID=UPI00201083B6|nr:hypothetical protein [Haloplanus sp. XH21]
MRRRDVLALSGFGLAALAGCSGRSPNTPTPMSTPSAAPDRHVPMGRTVTVDGTRLTVENPRVRKAAVSRGMTHTRVVAHAGQFVVADILIDGEPPDRTAALDFRSVVDGEYLPGSDPLPSVDGTASYAFSFPAERHETAAILRLTDGSRVSWDLPTTILETLALEPAFVVSDIRVLDRDGRLVLDMTVANEGARDGAFAARVSLEGFSGGHIVELPVPAGESRTYTGRPGDILLYLENQGGGTLTVHYPGDDGLTSVERTVQPARTTEPTA